METKVYALKAHKKLRLQSNQPTCIEKLASNAPNPTRT